MDWSLPALPVVFVLEQDLHFRAGLIVIIAFNIL